MAWKKRVLDSNAIKRRLLNLDGGPGSGNFGHKGRPGQEGGSGPGGASQAASGAGDYTNVPKGRGNGLPSRWDAHKADLYNDRIRNAKNETEARKALLGALKGMPNNMRVEMSVNGRHSVVSKNDDGTYHVKTFGIFDRPKKMTAAQIVAGSSMKPFERPNFSGDSAELVEDGGPGSGNFGHKGRPGLRGGSGKGGGKHYRSARNEVLGNVSKSGKNAGNKTGYTGSRRDWVNGLSGDKGHRADKFVDRWAPSGGTDEHTATEVAEAKVMSRGSKQDKLEYLDLKSESRLFDERKDRYMANLSDDEKKAFDFMEAFGATDAERLSNMTDPEMQDYYLDLKSKALEGPVFGVSMPDSVIKGAGLKKEAELPYWAGSIKKDKYIAEMGELEDKYRDDAYYWDKPLDDYILGNGSIEDVRELLSCAGDAFGYDNHVTKRDLQKKNRSAFDQALADRLGTLGFDGEQKALLDSYVWASGMGLQGPMAERMIKEIGSELKDKFSDIPEDKLLFAAGLKNRSSYIEAENVLTDDIDVGGLLTIDGTRYERVDSSVYMNTSTGELIDNKDLARNIVNNGIKTEVAVKAPKGKSKPGKRNCGDVNTAASNATLPDFVDYSTKVCDKKAKETLTDAEIEKATENLEAIFDKFPFRSRTEANYLRNIVEDHYKNQFEVGHSIGVYSPRFRAEVCGKLFGCGHDISDIAAEERECYGYLGSPDEYECAVGGASAKGYGGVSIAWKKEALAGSVTYTIGDSFGVYSETPAGSVNVENTTLGGFDSRNFFLNEIAHTDKKMIESTNNWNDIRMHLGIGGYLELQYHGDRLTADKIESIAFDSMSEYNKIPKGTIAKLKSLGVKLCVNYGGTPRYM